MTNLLVEDIKRHEGCQLVAYPDPASALFKQCTKCKVSPYNNGFEKLLNWKLYDGTPWTIGYGHTGVDVHMYAEITQEKAEQLLLSDIEKAKKELLKRYLFVSDLSEARKDVLINMSFNMGINRLSGFKNMFAAIKSNDFKKAASEMRNSAWYKQVRSRAEELAKTMEKG